MRSAWRKVLYRIGIFVILVILAIPTFIAGWLLTTWLLANKVPRRPKGVAQNAVFLWAPAVGFPGGLPRRGWWLACWDGNGDDYCKLTDIDGRSLYEGDYILYGNRGTVNGGELQIDPSQTAEKKVWIGDTPVPLIYLRNGKILVPAVAYDDATRLLIESNSPPSR
jgi:hypothetical protein